MSELWWCVICRRDRRFETVDLNGFSWLTCQSCGDSTCVTPEPEPVVPTEGDAA